jgi:chromosome segregation protein
VLKLLGETSTVRNQLAQVDQFLLGLDRDRERLTRDETTAAEDIERLNAASAELAERRGEREAELHGIAEARKHVEAELATRRSRASDTRRQLEEVRADASRLKARRDSLSEILLHRTYTTGTVKRLFSAVEKGQTGDWKPLGVLADFLESDGLYERAAEEFLHDELEYVAVSNWEEAERGLQWMRGGGEGHATFLVLPSAGGESIPSPVLNEAGVKSRLSDILRFSGSLANASPALVPRIARCFLVENAADAQELATRYPEYYFLLPDGVCFHGYTVSGGKKSGAGPLGLKRELREVTGKWQGRQKDFDDTRNTLEALEGEIAKFTEELEVLRGRQNLREKEAVALEHESRKLNEELNRSRSRLNIARNELARLTTERERSTARREDLRKSAEEKEAARLAQEHALTAGRAELEQLSREAARLAEEQSAVRVALAGLEERRKSDAAAQSRLQAQIRELDHRRNQVNGDMSRLGAERSRLLADNIELDNRSGVLATEMAALEEKVARIAAEETEVRAKLAAADEALKGIRQAAANVSERRTAFEIELVKKQAELKYLDETCRKDLGCELGELPAPEHEIDDAALAEAEAQSQALRSKIDGLGPVNTQAVEEFEEAQQRYDFLSAQRQDLLDSIRDTERAIAEIDAESRKRFAHAFEAINGHFREMFATLFNGGVGEMRLTDAENAMESGIDIVASPPGKKLQSVLLLSGGERALTAMALLMAIFRFQPSPFCVLDEVDAPLDDANTERLVRLIKEMATHTQFVVITHSKRTMEAAQALYGVTMQEPGVSKLVSVRFAPVPPPAVPAVQPQLAM